MVPSWLNSLAASLPVDSEYFQFLMSAKRGEMVKAGIVNPTSDTTAIKKDELARRTKGVEKTIQEIEALLISLLTATDTLGVPLLKEEIKDI